MGIEIKLTDKELPISPAMNQIVASTNQQTGLLNGNVSGAGDGGIGTGESKEEKQKKPLPICSK